MKRRNFLSLVISTPILNDPFRKKLNKSYKQTATGISIMRSEGLYRKQQLNNFMNVTGKHLTMKEWKKFLVMYAEIPARSIIWS